MASLYSLPQAERINSKKEIDRLFHGGRSKSMTISPLRVVYMAEVRDGETRGPVARMMVSVPKRHFKRAVKRNLVKRQVREAYRLNKHLLTDRIEGITVSMCFIWTADQIVSTADVQERMRKLLARMAERLAATAEAKSGEAHDGKEA